MIVCGNHNVVLHTRSRRKMGEEEFAGHSIQHRRPNDVTVDLGRHADIGQGFIDKAFDAIQHKGNNLDHRLQYVLAVPGLHNGFASVKVQQQIDALP